MINGLVDQVACGLNLTVALSTDGLVYQMGATGAEAAHVEWEGARNPTRVEGRLKGHFADKVLRPNPYLHAFD